MTPAARIASAIDVLTDIETHRRPTTDAIRDWGKAHRFAGSGDRANVANLVYDTLRVKASAGHLMGDDSRRKTGMTFDAQPGRKPGIAQ